MTAATKDRATDERDGRRVHDPLASATTIYAGTIYMLDAGGDAVPAVAQSGTTTLVARGVALKRASTAAGDTSVEGGLGVYQFENSASSDEITRTEIGATCYVVDDCTVAKTSDSSKRPKAGTVLDVDASGVWVRIGA